MNKEIKHINLLVNKLSVILFLLTVEIFNLSGQKEVTIAFLTDLHVNPDSPSDSALHRIVNEINEGDFDFTIVSGDLTNTGSDAELIAVKKALDKLKMPCHVLPGNHETNWSESAGLTFNELWGADRFYFRFNNFIFAGFNTGPFMRMGDGLVKQEDLQWLKRKLGESSTGDNVLISFSHYPLSEGLSNWPEVTKILKSAHCRLSFCGHGHKLSLYNFNGIPGIMGRSVITGNSPLPGYNIIRITGDSVRVFNKVLGKRADSAVIEMNYMNPDTLSGIPVSPLPDYSVNNSYSKLRKVTFLTDTASTFTGPCLVNDTILIYCNSVGWVKGLSTTTQKIIWQLRIAGPVYSTPVNCRGTIALGSVDGNIMGISRDGSLVFAKLMNDTLVAISALENYPLTKWAVSGGFGYEHNPCPVLATEKSVIAATRAGEVVAIDPVTKAVEWRYKAGNSSVNKVVAGSDGRFWFTLMEGILMSITVN